MNHTSQSGGQELHMGLLVRSNGLQVGVEGVHVSSADKVLLGVVLQALCVESGLEVLKSQGVVEDIS